MSSVATLDEERAELLAEILGIGRHQLPEFEADAEALRFLYSFLSNVETQKRLATAESEHAALFRDQYYLEGTRIQEQLDVIGVTRKALSREAQSCVGLMASIAEKLSLRKPHLNGVASRWAELCLQQHSSDATRRMVSEVGERSEKMCEKMQGLKERLLATCETTASFTPVEVALPPNAEGKIQQYRQDAEHFKLALQQRGYTPELSHQAIQHKAHKVQEMRERVATLKRELGQYDAELPRELEGAKRRLEETRADMERIKDAIRTKMVVD